MGPPAPTHPLVWVWFREKGQEGTREEAPLLTTAGHQRGTVLGLSQEQSRRCPAKDFVEVKFRNTQEIPAIFRALINPSCEGKEERGLVKN